jgi:acyl-CoA synthetase (AMP-forming)/AMP-acid ligase II
VLVVGPDGQPLGPGELGEFVIRGPHVMTGYWRRDSQTDERFPPTADGGRELRTGDFGWLDEDGYLYVDGRRDDVYKERGFRVSTVEIEAAAHKVPGVRLAVVIPPSRSTRPHAVLVVSGPITREKLVRGLRKEIEPFKVPHQCLILDEIPLSNNGKIDQKAVAELVEAHASVQ